MARIARASIKDIARQVGVSVSTVSYALNDGPKPVADELKARIRRVAAEMDYRPNRLARRMASKRTDVIGVAHSAGNFDFLRNTVILEVLVGISNEAQRQNVDLLIHTHAIDAGEVGFSHPYADGQTDGHVFIFPDMLGQQLSDLAELGQPAVVVEGHAPNEIPNIESENERGAEMAVRHLIELGHRRIAHLKGMTRMYDTYLRHDAFLRTMREHEVPIHPEWVLEGNYDADVSYHATRRLLAMRPRPTAIFCANDHSAVGALRAAQEAGVSVPRDLSLVGYDDTPDARMSVPRLTTVRQPLEQMGEAAVRTLLDLIRGAPKLTPDRFPVELIVRDSTAHPMEDHS